MGKRGGGKGFALNLFENYRTRTITIKKTEDSLKGHSAFINRLGCHQRRYLHFYEKSSYNFRVLQPFVLDALNNKLDFSNG